VQRVEARKVLLQFYALLSSYNSHQLAKAARTSPVIMAASILGKRTRSTFDVEGATYSVTSSRLQPLTTASLEVSSPGQSHKRRTRNATPRIHRDDAEPPKSQTHQEAAESINLDGPPLDAPASRPTPTRNASKKHDKCIPFPISESFLTSDVHETESGTFDMVLMVKADGL